MLPFSLEIKSIDHNYFRIWTNRSCWQQFFDFFVSFVFNPFVDLNSCNSVARIIYVKLQILSIKMLFPGFHHFVRWALTRQKLLSLICSKRPDQNQNGQIRILNEPKSARTKFWSGRLNRNSRIRILCGQILARSEFWSGRFDSDPASFSQDSTKGWHPEKMSDRHTAGQSDGSTAWTQGNGRKKLAYRETRQLYAEQMYICGRML